MLLPSNLAETLGHKVLHRNYCYRISGFISFSLTPAPNVCRRECICICDFFSDQCNLYCNDNPNCCKSVVSDDVLLLFYFFY